MKNCMIPALIILGMIIACERFANYIVNRDFVETCPIWDEKVNKLLDKGIDKADHSSVAIGDVWIGTTLYPNRYGTGLLPYYPKMPFLSTRKRLKEMVEAKLMADMQEWDIKKGVK